MAESESHNTCVLKATRASPDAFDAICVDLGLGEGEDSPPRLEIWNKVDLLDEVTRLRSRVQALEFEITRLRAENDRLAAPAVRRRGKEAHLQRLCHLSSLLLDLVRMRPPKRIVALSVFRTVALPLSGATLLLISRLLPRAMSHWGGRPA